MRAAHEASGTDMVTVAVRRVDISRKTESLLDYIDTSKIFLLPNTAACYTADDAIRTARLGREAGMSNWVKLEVIGDEKTLFPDNEGLLEATRVLVKEGFIVLPYTNDDPVMCRKLADAGAAAVMPLGAPIGSGLGIQNPNNIRIIKEQATRAGDRRCRRRHRLGRRGGDGAGRRRRADEHRDRRRAGSGGDGARDEAGGRGRPAGLPGRPHPAEVVRDRQQSLARCDRIVVSLPGIATPPMRTTTIRFLDYWLGVPACALLTRGPRDHRRLARTHARGPQRLLFLKFIEQGATVLAQDAIARATRAVGRDNIFFCVFESNRAILDVIGTVPAREHHLASATGRSSTFVVDFLSAAMAVRRHRIDTVIDMEFFSRASAIFAFLTGRGDRVGLHRFTGELPYRGDLMTHRIQYLPQLHISMQYSVLVEAAFSDPPDEPLLKVPLEQIRVDVASRVAGVSRRPPPSSNAMRARLGGADRADRRPQSQRQRSAAAAQMGDRSIRRAGDAHPRGLPGRARRAHRRAVGASGRRGAVPLARLTARDLGGGPDQPARAADALHARQRARHQRQRPGPLRVADAGARDRAVRSGNAAPVRSAGAGDDGDLEGAGVQPVRERLQPPAVALPQQRLHAGDHGR